MFLVLTRCALSHPAFLLSDSPNPIGRALHLRVFGTIATTSAATFANAINVNPTAGTSTGNVTVNAAYTPTSAVTAPWNLDAWITCTAYLTAH